MCKRLGVLCQSTASQNNKAATRYIVGKGCIQYCVLAVWFFFFMWLSMCHLTFYVILCPGPCKEGWNYGTQNHWLQKTFVLNQRHGKGCWPQACLRDSSQDVVYLSLFIVLWLKLYVCCLISSLLTHFSAGCSSDLLGVSLPSLCLTLLTVMCICSVL